MSLLDIESNLDNRKIEIEGWLKENCDIKGKYTIYKRKRKWLVDIDGTIFIKGECEYIPYNTFCFDKVYGNFIIEAPLKSAKGLPKMIHGNFRIKNIMCDMWDFKNYPKFIVGGFEPYSNVKVYNMIQSNTFPYCFSVFLMDIDSNDKWSYDNLKNILLDNHYASNVQKIIEF